MGRRYDVVIVGGGPSGYVTALMAKKLYPEKSVLIIRREEKVLIPCAIPYLFHSIKSIDQNILPDEPLRKQGIDVLVDEVMSINLSNRIVKTAKGEEVSFDRLVLATGARPTELKVEGTHLKNVFYVYKEYNYMKNFVEAVREAENIVIVGGGFVGVEMADDIARLGKKVTIVEMLPHCLLRNFDEDFVVLAEEELKKLGVVLKTNTLVTKIEGNERVRKVKLSTGEEIPADVVIISIGTRSNVDLAQALGLRIGPLGGIEIDACRRTSNPIVFAVGDCTEKRDFVTGKPCMVHLASVAINDARIVAYNLFKPCCLCRPPLAVGAFSTKIGDLAFGSVGIMEGRARDEGIDYVVGYAEAVDKHPGVLPTAKKVRLKLIVARATEEIIGAQVVGGPSVGEYVNLLCTLIQYRAKLIDLITMQIATHPWLTPSPVAYTLYVAALDAYKELH